MVTLNLNTMRNKLIFLVMIFVVHLNYQAISQEVRIEPNTKITIESGTTMDITTGNLVLESDATGDVSLIVLGSVDINNNGKTNAQRYLPGDAQAWHYLGTPVSGMAISGSVFEPGANDDFYAWNEPAPGTWVNYKVTNGDLYFAQASVNNGDNLLPGKGYMIAYNESNPTKTFSGTLNTGNVTFNLKNSGSGTYSGWNLISNPYSSSIDWNTATRTQFQDDFAYVYDPNKSGGEGYATVNGSASDAFIGPHQGFFVLAEITSNNQNFTFNNALQTHGGGSYMKSNTSKDELILRLSSENYFDETTIMVNEQSRFIRDRNDALKLYSYNQSVPQLYSISEDEINLSVNSIPDMTVETPIPIGIRTPEEGSYIIGLLTTTNDFGSSIIYLEDKALNKLHKISEEDYMFTSSQGDFDNRFLLHFGITGLEDNDEPYILNIWAYNNQLNIISEQGEAQIEIFDIQGRLMKSKSIFIKGKHNEILNLQPGVYVVRFKNSSMVKSTQILIN